MRSLLLTVLAGLLLSGQQATTATTTQPPNITTTATTTQPPNITTTATTTQLPNITTTVTTTQLPNTTATAIATQPQTTTNGNNIAQSPSWVNNILNTIGTLVNSSANQPSSLGNNSQLLGDLLSRLPGVFQGQAGGVKVGAGNDVGQILASLFADPRVAGIPGWIESLTGEVNSSQAVRNAETIVKALSDQDTTQQLQAVLGHVFPDVIKGLTSLNLDTNSTAETVVTAIMADKGLTSSLSTAAQEMLSVLARDPGLAATLRQAFPLDPKSQCAADLVALGAGLQQGDMWALQMLDAMGKPMAGILTGQLTLFGDYEECKAISHSNGSRTIEGQMCGMTLKAPDMLNGGGLFGAKATIDFHTCLPQSCREAELWGLFLPAVKSLKSEIWGVSCIRPKDPTGDDLFLGTVITIGILAALCIMGTAYGVSVDSEKDTQRKGKTLKHQSPKTNGYTNGGFTSERESDTQKGGHVNGDMTNGNIIHMKSLEAGDGEGVLVNGRNGHTGGVKENGTAVSRADRQCTEDRLASKLLLSFSVLRNGRKVLDCSHNKADITCLHGIRVLSITWVILGHCFSQLGPAQGNKSAVATLLGHFPYMVLPGALLAVDTFFLLSGCLTAFLFLRSTHKSGLSVSAMVLYYVHRIWRLTPMYGLLLAFYMGVFPYLLEGPYAKLAGLDSTTTCRHHWYLNILYVNNVVSDSLSKVCFGWSWYLSNDMQFYVIAPICLIPWALKGRVRILGFVVAVAFILTHIITSAIFSYTEEASIFTNGLKYMEDIYFVPWCRVGPYAVGLLLGYLLHVNQCRYTMTTMSVFLGWTMATTVGVVLVYIHYDNLGDLTHGVQWSPSQYATYEALGKVVWAVCVAWVVFACCTGHGGYVNTLLSWSAWAPLSRLTYGVYLVHLIVLNTLAGNFRRPFYMDGWTGACLTIAVTVLSFLMSFTFSMLIEAPTLGLEKAVLAKIFRKKK